MKILHIVPTAFEYFENIRKEAFGLVDSLGQLGFDVDIITLQYDAVSKRFQNKIAQETKERIGFKKIYSKDELVEKIEEADIVHLHTPFLGMGKKLLKYKKEHPQKKFIITLYQNLPYSDLFTIIIWLYNNYYLRRLMNVADFVIAENEQIFRSGGGFAYLKDLNKFVSIENFKIFLLESNPRLIENINNLKINKTNLHTAVAYGELYRLLGGE
ncbi:MAG: glycosyltransferase family 4 protein [Candidatus Magasanikbacteria bacterium]|nr:glycosyltransferase family 4 protein [Candidatus Magasanikbacteria bacterium]